MEKKLHLVSPLLLVLLLSLRHQFVEGEGFVQTKGVQFVLNGNPFYANGFNAYWLMTLASDASQRDKVSTVFREAPGNSLSVARTWAFSDGGSNALQYSPGSYNEQTFQGLDFVVSEAGKYGVKLILSLVNNYDSFGGKKQYVNWARNQGQYISSDDDFFSNSLVKQYYKNHVKAVLTRVNTVTGVAYKDDPTIFAWELMNEPRCPSDPSGATIQKWITEMAAHVKSIDANHMLEAGLEGFYAPTAARSQINPSFQIGTDFISNNLISGIDFATLHSYPDQWMANSNDDAQLSFLSNWLDAHIQDAQDVLRKPLLITEFGKSLKDPGYNNNQRDALFSMVYSKIYLSARNEGAAAGGLFWQLFVPGMDNYSDGYEVVLGETPSTTNVITAQCKKLHYLRRMFARANNLDKAERAKEMRERQGRGN
ncbi:mannan endo-1,4-beta-mannosidase 1-like protein [Carex littledalei]|uniref:mannan endo-1,4-beta-mannosidase n=1 Tax=Carex littledalei TaxID=544730 RepID=A0A833R618_9POAL|nr:mannan endo-1,4-beta-mannosidase 1-like protein [Carex littledalei]